MARKGYVSVRLCCTLDTGAQQYAPGDIVEVPRAFGDTLLADGNAELLVPEVSPKKLETGGSAGNEQGQTGGDAGNEQTPDGGETGSDQTPNGEGA